MKITTINFFLFTTKILRYRFDSSSSFEDCLVVADTFVFEFIGRGGPGIAWTTVGGLHHCRLLPCIVRTFHFSVGPLMLLLLLLLNSATRRLLMMLMPNVSLCCLFILAWFTSSSSSTSSVKISIKLSTVVILAWSKHVTVGIVVDRILGIITEDVHTEEEGDHCEQHCQTQILEHRPRDE